MKKNLRLAIVTMKRVITMKIRKKNIIICFLAFISAVSFYALLKMHQKKEVLNVNCSSVLQYYDTKSGFSAEMNLVLVLSPQEYGYIDMSGYVKHNENTSIISRKIKFAYEREADETYKISGLILVKQTSDNTPDEIMDRVFFTISHQNERNFNLRRVSNAYVIGNLHSPIYMCVVK